MQHFPMNQRALIVAVVFFVVIVIGMFAYARFKSNELRNAEPLPPAAPAEQSPEITYIDAKHYLKNGVHTIAGEIMMPTPCDLLESNATVGTSSPEQVTIAFTVINNTEGVCAQVITPQRFKVSFEAGENPLISATFKGEKAILNLVEAEPDENPDDFELFIKG